MKIQWYSKVYRENNKYFIINQLASQKKHKGGKRFIPFITT